MSFNFFIFWLFLAIAERRILLIGDSSVLGHTVLPRHHFGRTLEALLSQATGETVRTLNFGRAEVNFWNMYEYFEDFAGTFDHDMALFFVGDGDLIPARQTASDLYPVVTLVGEDLVIDRSFRDSPGYRIYRATELIVTHAAVLRLAFNAHKMVVRGKLAAVLLDKFAPGSSDTDSPPAGPAAVHRAPVLPEVIRAMLRELARDSRNVLVIDDGLSPALRDEVSSAGLWILDLGAALAEARGGDPYYWPVMRVRGHWNHAAHRAIARFLAEASVARSLVWPPSAARVAASASGPVAAAAQK